MADTTKNTVVIKIDLPNIDQTTQSVKNLATHMGSLGTGAKGQLNWLEKLGTTVRSGAKLTAQQIETYQTKIKNYTTNLEISIKKYNNEVKYRTHS